MRTWTEKEVAAFAKEHRGRRAETSVGKVPGLVARVAASGEVSYALRYRERGSKRQRTLTIGAVTLADAREEARRILAEARVGVDPWEALRAERLAAEAERRSADRTVGHVVDLWLRSHEAAPRKWSAGTRREYEGLMRRHVLPAFGDRDPNLVTRGEVRKVLDDVAEEHPSEANHAHAALRALYGWLRKGHQDHLGVTAHPLLGLEKPGGRAKPRSRVYTGDEVRRIFAAARGTSVEDLVALLFHTGTRDRETRAMRWADVDLDSGVWTVPAEESKSGRPHAVALSSGALEVLRRRPRFGEHVFPNPATSTGYIDRPNHKVLRAVAVRAGLLRNVGTEEEPEWEGESLRLHDVRRTVGDRLKLEHGEAVMHAALGHSEAMLTRTYGPTPRLKVLADAMEWWAGEIVRILGARREEGRA